MSEPPPPPPPPSGAAPPAPPPAPYGATPPPPWGGPAQPFPPASGVRPSTAWYWIAGVVGLVCVLVGIVLIVRTAVLWVDKIDDFRRVSVPGTETIHLDEGSYTVYVENGFFGDTDTWSFDGSVEIRDSREGLVELRRYDGRKTYDVNDHEGLALWSFHADETGNYRVTTSGNSGMLVAIGPGLGAGIVGGVLGGIGLIVLGILFALITIIVTAIRRGTSRRRQFAETFPPYPG